eukprot:scaffold5246_cov72-Skeletonema_dohrnii-CCMP3373.AAC.2
MSEQQMHSVAIGTIGRVVGKKCDVVEDEKEKDRRSDGSRKNLTPKAKPSAKNMVMSPATVPSNTSSHSL